MSAARVRTICWAALLVVASSCLLEAQVPAAPTAEDNAAAEVVADPAAPQPGPAAEPPNVKKRQNLTAVASWMLIGVVLMGFLLLMFVIILGYQTRRIARKRSPQSGPLDELWYLRPPKKPKSPNNVAETNDSSSGESDTQTA